MKLPVASGKELLKFFGKLGFRVIRQRGSHISLYNDSNRALVVIVNTEETKKKTLLSIIRQAKMTRDEFIELWNKH